MKNIAVFCGAQSGHDPEHARQAGELGRLLVEEGYGIVYGGGSTGLMGEMARAASAAGGNITGVITHHLHGVECALSAPGVSMVYTESMHTRKSLMVSLADAFLILPGGLGTLDELFEVLTASALGLINKPVILVSYDSYYVSLIVALLDMRKAGFISGVPGDSEAAEDNAEAIACLKRAFG